MNAMPVTLNLGEAAAHGHVSAADDDVDDTRDFAHALTGAQADAVSVATPHESADPMSEPDSKTSHRGESATSASATALEVLAVSPALVPTAEVVATLEGVPGTKSAASAIGGASASKAAAALKAGAVPSAELGMARASTASPSDGSAPRAAAATKSSAPSASSTLPSGSDPTAFEAATSAVALATETTALVAAHASMRSPLQTTTADAGASAIVRVATTGATRSPSSAAAADRSTADRSTAGRSTAGRSTAGHSAPGDATAGGSIARHLASTGASSTTTTDAHASSDASSSEGGSHPENGGEAAATSATLTEQVAPAPPRSSSGATGAPTASGTSDALPGVASQLLTVLQPLRQLANGSQTLTIALHPEGLGDVKATMTLTDDSLVVRLAPTTSAAADALRQAIPDLQSGMSQNAGSTTVVLADQNGQFSGQFSSGHTGAQSDGGQGGNGQFGGYAPQPALTGGADADESPSLAPPSLAPSSSSQLDVRV